MRFITAGESHGPRLTAIIDGYPGGVVIDPSFFSREMARRKRGYGRGGRMMIEDDALTFTGGVRFSETTGAPVCIEISNKDFDNWRSVMDPFAPKTSDRSISKPRPGHADLAGSLKFARTDIRDVLERASARETAPRVAVGALCKTLLSCFGIECFSVVWEIGGEGIPWGRGLQSILEKKSDISILHSRAEKNDLRIPLDRRRRVYDRIDAAKNAGDSLGGVLTVAVRGLPPGLGSHVQHDTRLDGRLAAALMGIPAVKAVSIGGGMFVSSSGGSAFHDALYLSKGKTIFRKTNFAGGIEGGMSNGEDLVATCFMKPIPTMLSPLPSVDLKKMIATSAVYERSDVTAVPACSVVAEAMAAYCAADAFVTKFGADSVKELGRNFDSYLESIRRVWKKSS